MAHLHSQVVAHRPRVRWLFVAKYYSPHTLVYPPIAVPGQGLARGPRAEWHRCAIPRMVVPARCDAERALANVGRWLEAADEGAVTGTIQAHRWREKGFAHTPDDGSKTCSSTAPLGPRIEFENFEEGEEVEFQTRPGEKGRKRST